MPNDGKRKPMGRRAPPADPFGTALIQRPDAEKDALAGMLNAIDCSPTEVAELAARLTPEMFTDQLRADIITAIRAALQNGSPGIADVFNAIRRQSAAAGQDYDEVKAAAVDLIQQQHGPRPIRLAAEAAEEVREAYLDREKLLAIEDAAAAVRSGAGTTELAEAIERLTSLQHAAEDGRAQPSKGLVDVLDAWARDVREPVVRTLFEPIDRRLGGGLPIGLTGIAARPGIGKSALACQLTLGSLLADPAIKAVWFRGEMTSDLLARRIVAAWSGIRGNAVAAATSRDSARRSESARKVALDLVGMVGDRLQIIDPPLTPESIEREIRRHRPRLAVIDYLQLVETAAMADRRAEIEQAIRRLAWLSERYEVAFLVVSAIAGARTRTSGVGTIGKETNLLDYTVHCLISLWADEREDGMKRPDPYTVEMRIEKNRTGPTGEIPLYFTGSGQYFTPVEVDDFPPAEGFEEFEAFAPEATP